MLIIHKHNVMYNLETTHVTVLEASLGNHLNKVPICLMISGQFGCGCLIKLKIIGVLNQEIKQSIAGLVNTMQKISSTSNMGKLSHLVKLIR